jgi:tetratricopeptide (TPR) repeat protein
MSISTTKPLATLNSTVGIISTTVAILLTILNFNLSREKQIVDSQLATARIELEKQDLVINQSRESTERYRFVSELLPQILEGNQDEISITTNLITLVLDDSESEKLFAGFLSSGNVSLQQAAETGSEILVAQQTKLGQVTELERLGFQSLVNGDYNQALNYFQQAESVYPTFHNVYEITNLLQANEAKLTDIAVQKKIAKRIVEEYAWKAPQDELQILRNFAE